MADGEKGFEKGFLGKRRIQAIETLTKEKATLSAGRPRVARARLERRGRAFNVQVVRVIIPYHLIIYNMSDRNPSKS